MNDIECKLISIYESNGLNSSQEDFEVLDSLTFIKVVVDIEKEFNVEYPDDLLNIELFRLHINDMTEIIQKLVAEKYPTE